MSRNQYPEFQGKIAVVTGAAQGIGREVALQLLHAGAVVVSLDNRFENTSFSKKNSDGVIPLHLNIVDYHQVRSVFDRIESQVGAIDYLVHSAGILHLGNLTEITKDDWKEIFEVNTHGTFNVCTECACYMRSRKRGAIVSIGSNASSIPRIGMGAYAASKSAATMLIKSLALELAEHNIRCNVIAPGSTDTAMQRQLWKNTKGVQKIIDGDNKNYRLGIPLNRIATSKDIANTVLFLLSNQANHITMEVLKVDGGATLGCH